MTDEVSPVALINALLRKRRALFGIPLLAVVIVCLASLFQSRQYISEAAFMPDHSQAGSTRLAGLASTFGINLPMNGDDRSPQFYADLASSPEILGPIVDTTYSETNRAAGNQTTIADILTARDLPPLRKHNRAIRELKSRITATVNDQTGVVELAVRTERPHLSFVILQMLLRDINAFDIASRQERAVSSEHFAQERMNEVKAKLATAENAVAAFLQRNRDYRGDPGLTVQYDRLQREVSMQQDVFTSLAQNAEQSRIDALRNAPTIVLLQRPALPDEPESRKLALKALLAGFATLFAVGFIIVIIELIRRSSDQDAGERRAFRELRAQAVTDLRRLSLRK